MTYTFDQMMKGEGLPDNSVRSCYRVTGTPSLNEPQTYLEDRARARFLSDHRHEPTEICHANNGNDLFVCMVWS